MKIIECVPNFSEGNDESIINAITTKIKEVDGVTLLDVDPGKAANRTVVTFVGDPDSVIEAAFRAIKIASKLIDMNNHKGEHPRMGATDVCPLIPIQGVSINECVKYSKMLASKVSKELNIPTYLYEFSASNKNRINLANIREGEFENFSKKISLKEWKPDYGSIKVGKAGVTAIGARNFLIAYNINLNTNNKSVATDIALDIREKGRFRRDENNKILRDKNGTGLRKPGKFKFCKAVGWYIKEYNQAQVSINLTNFKKTSLHKVFDEVRKLARKKGFRVTGSEIVGMVPKQALLDTGIYYLKKQKNAIGIPDIDIIYTAIQSLGLNDISEFNFNKRIIEFINSEDNDCESLDDFINNVSRATPTPGGGSVSALSGALGGSLSSMVANLSISKKGFEKDYNYLNDRSSLTQKSINRLMKLIIEDSNSYDKVIEAIRLPKKNKSDQIKRLKAIENANIYATEIPLQILIESNSIIKNTLDICVHGNPNSISDIAVASELLKSAAYGASYNIRINIKDINSKKRKYFIDKTDYYLKQVDDYYIKIKNHINKIL